MQVHRAGALEPWVLTKSMLDLRSRRGVIVVGDDLVSLQPFSCRSVSHGTGMDLVAMLL